MSHDYDLIVNGAAGRMGRLVAASLRGAGFGRVAGCDPGTASPLGLEGESLPLVADLVEALRPGGVIVDFSHPDATASLCRAAHLRQARLVIGTTAQSAGDLDSLRRAAAEVPVVVARNFSLGINRLLEALPALRGLISEGFDVECIEAHHRQKRDAPSGTALLLLEALLGADSQAPRVHGRHGTEALRRQGEVGVHSLRLGQLVGEHALLFASDHEMLEIRHRAFDRQAFVTGVLPAVRFVLARPAGFYSLRDVMRDAAESGT